MTLPAMKYKWMIFTYFENSLRQAIVVTDGHGHWVWQQATDSPMLEIIRRYCDRTRPIGVFGYIK